MSKHKGNSTSIINLIFNYWNIDDYAFSASTSSCTYNTINIGSSNQFLQNICF